MTTQADAGGKTDATLPPGIYGLDAAFISARHQAVVIATDRSDDELLRVIAASQWRLTRVMPKPLNMFQMRLADRFAMLRVRGSQTAAEATITQAVAVPLKMTGSDRANATVSCLPFIIGASLDDPANSPVNVSVVYEGAGDVHAMVSFRIKAIVGTQPIAFDQTTANATVYRGTSSFLEMMGAAMLSQVQPDPKVYHEYFPTPEATGTAVVTSLEPFAGTVHMSGLKADRGRKLEVEAGFSVILPPAAIPAKPTS